MDGATCIILGGIDAGETRPFRRRRRLRSGSGCRVGRGCRGAIVVLGGSGVRAAGEDLGVAEGDAAIEGVGDGVPQGVRADVPWDASGFRDPRDHDGRRRVGRAAAGDRSQYQRRRSISGSEVRWPRHASRTRSTGTVSGLTAPSVERTGAKLQIQREPSARPAQLRCDVWIRATWVLCSRSLESLQR
jgi:hypothetical protein